MELQSARQIIDTLAQGIHPVTGEAMPEDSPYNAPPVIRALFAVAKALDAPRGRLAPANAGKPWTAEDDEQLQTAFTTETDLKLLAGQVGRTAWAVESRLIKLGRLPERAGGSYRTPVAA